MFSLEINNIINHSQCGRDKSATNHLAQFNSEVDKVLHNGQHAVAVFFFDLENAYQKAIKHNILVNTTRYGIQNHMMDFINNLLDDMKFMLKFQNQDLNLRSQINGTPQW